ncbi:ABC transporter permease subunit [Thermanaerothrix sp. 4228-RoL]|uniref:ABC transporter permease subunit n=1 Tax=Thermanaerothrix solaris TaxID=3058434 RepID=A0ABU3NMX7_9CHLR|nr:ABC transporter permease subunit [Thermanaerothrix sp. 4228-RoL]MDT8898201.1 ABC transporter permease subunit [Thermanaerothrix sp. 4228-RoL]
MKRKHSFLKSFSHELPLLLLALPGLVYLIINNYIPMLGIIIAFKKLDYAKGILKSDWVGLKNFEFLFSTPDAWIMTRNTLLYNLAFIIIGTIFAIVLAIMMNEIADRFFAKYFQGMYLLPNLISWVVVSYIVFAFLNADTGLIPKVILPALRAKDINFYTSPGYWPFILLIVFLWKNTGYTSVIYLSSIAGIDRTIYEAARIDGAGKLDQIRYITLPLLKPTIIILFLFSIGRMMYSDFGLFYQVTLNSGALFSTTQTIDTYVYRALMQFNNVNMASAAGVYQSIVGFILVLGANLLIKKINPENALF